MEFSVTSSPLFAGLSPDRQTEALTLLSAARRRYARGEMLHREGEPLPAFGLVLSGLVQVSCYEPGGAMLLMASVPVGRTFGESLCYLSRPAEVYIRAAEPCEVLWLRPDALRAPESPLARELAHRFTSLLAARTLEMNDRIQVLSRRTLREKVLALLARLGRPGEPVLLPMDREAMAAYLGCDRAALSRELSRMAREGLIAYRKNRFEIL